MQKTALRPAVQAFPAQKSSAPAGRLKIRAQKTASPAGRSGFNRSKSRVSSRPFRLYRLENYAYNRARLNRKQFSRR